MGAEHAESVTEIKGFLVALPSPVSIGGGETAFTRAVGDSIFQAFTALMPIKRSMGMYAGAIAGKSSTVFGMSPSCREGMGATRRKN